MLENQHKKYGRLYLESYKRAIVAEIEREGNGIKIVCERHGLPTSSVHRWISEYGSPDYLANRQHRRSLSEKNTIIREIISGRSTISEVQAKYQIDCRDTITLWIRQYKKAQQELADGAVKEPVSISQDVQVTELQKELELARLKIRALEVVVDIASEQFKVDIRKKFGAKQ